MGFGRLWYGFVKAAINKDTYTIGYLYGGQLEEASLVLIGEGAVKGTGKLPKVLSKGKPPVVKKALNKVKKSFENKSPRKLNNKYVKASKWERLTKTRLNVSDLVMNSKDDIAKVGPSDKKISQYMNEIKRTGKIFEPIEVHTLSTGKYEIVDGHHRWLATKKTGLKKVPVRITKISLYRLDYLIVVLHILQEIIL